MAERKSALRTVRIVLWIFVALAAVGALAVYFAADPDRGDGVAPESTISEPGMAELGGPFTLVRADGEPFTQADLKGRPHVLFFGFTRCPDVCPTTLQRMAKLRREMNAADPGSGDAFEIVFVSVDPGHDTPEDVGRYVDLFGTPIIGLAGSEEQIAQVAKAYGIYYAKRPIDGGDYTMDHSATVMLLDREGKFAGTIDSQEKDAVAIQKLERLSAA